MSNEKNPNCFGVCRGLSYPVMSVPGLHVRLLIRTLPETNSLSHLKMDGWNTSFPLGWAIFRAYVSFREGMTNEKNLGCLGYIL